MKTVFFLILIVSISLNSSAQWFAVSSNTDSHIRTVHFTDENNGWIAGSSDFINKTYDGGETWTDNGIGFHGSTNNLWYSIFAINSDDVYTCGSTYNYDRWQTNYALTVNGGNSWEFQTSWGSAVGSVKQVFFIDNENGWQVGYSAPSGRLWRTTNGLSDWSFYSRLDHSPYSVYFIDQNTGWIACAEGYVLTSGDGGENWNEVSTGMTEALRSIFFINSSIGWAVGDNDDVGVIIKTTNGGESWYQVNHQPTFSMNCVQFVNENTGWACGSKVENLEERGVILYTNDGGENWSEQYVCDKLSTLYELFFIDELTGWAVGYDGIVVKTTNAGGTSFEGVNEDSFFTRSLNIYPNPFTTSTTLLYELKQPSTVQLNVFNQFGQLVYQYSEKQQQGSQQLQWEEQNQPEGIYYYSLKAGDQTINGKIVKGR